jgi:hypothetical protein
MEFQFQLPPVSIYFHVRVEVSIFDLWLFAALIPVGFEEAENVSNKHKGQAPTTEPSRENA